MKPTTDHTHTQHLRRLIWTYRDHPTYALMTAEGIAKCHGTLRDPRRYPAPCTGRPVVLRLQAGSSAR
jgi:hypothetical protein